MNRDYIRGMHWPVRERFEKLVESYGADFVIAALAEHLSEERKQRFAEVLTNRLQGVTVVLEDLYDPHNGAAVLRSVEALGLGEIHSVGEESVPFSKEVSIGCQRWVNTVHHPDIATASDHLKKSGYTIVGTTPEAKVSMYDMEIAGPIAILLGNEHSGLTEQALSLCDKTIFIPMFGFTRSFNLSVSAAIITNQVVTRIRHQNESPQTVGQWSLTETEKKQLLALWYAEDTKGSELILERYSKKFPNKGEPVLSSQVMGAPV